MDDREEVEQIPWQELLARVEPEDGRRRNLYLAAGLVGAVVVGMFVARMWWVPQPAAAPMEAPSEAADDSGGDDLPDIDLPVVPGLPRYSEADLMAFPDDLGQRVAMARAEWFVTDYFTADLEPGGSAEVRSALPSGALGAYPQDSTDGISYVEWARAFSVEPLGDGSYRVGVLFRSLAAPPDRGFIRQPVRAVEVVVAVRPDGGSSVLDVPAPIPLPAGPEPPVIEDAVTDQPPGVVEAAVERASSWGAEPRLVSVHRTATGWRVLLTVADGAGIRWPLAVRVPG